jgi:hypothetical protein
MGGEGQEPSCVVEDAARPHREVRGQCPAGLFH